MDDEVGSRCGHAGVSQGDLLEERCDGRPCPALRRGLEDEL
jgi:hypothetical protein